MTDEGEVDPPKSKKPKFSPIPVSESLLKRQWVKIGCDIEGRTIRILQFNTLADGKLYYIL